MMFGFISDAAAAQRPLRAQAPQAAPLVQPLKAASASDRRSSIEDRRQRVDASRQLKRKQLELESKQQTLMAQLAEVKENIDDVVQRKKRNRARSPGRSITLRPDLNEVHAIPMSTDDVGMRCFSQDARRGLARHLAGGKDPDADEEAAPCVQPCALQQPSSAPAQEQQPASVCAAAGEQPRRTHGMVTRSVASDGTVPYHGISGCIEAASSMLCLERLQTWSWFGAPAPIRKHKPALKLSLQPKQRLPGKISRRSPRKGRSPPRKGGAAQSDWQELFPRNGPLIAFGSP